MADTNNKIEITLQIKDNILEVNKKIKALEKSLKQAEKDLKSSQKNLKQFFSTFDQASVSEQDYKAIENGIKKSIDSARENLKKVKEEINAARKEAVNLDKDFLNAVSSLSSIDVAENAVKLFEKKSKEIKKVLDEVAKQTAEGVGEAYDNEIKSLADSNANLPADSDEYKANSLAILALEQEKRKALEEGTIDVIKDKWKAYYENNAKLFGDSEDKKLILLRQSYEAYAAEMQKNGNDALAFEQVCQEEIASIYAAKRKKIEEDDSLSKKEKTKRLKELLKEERDLYAKGSEQYEEIQAKINAGTSKSLKEKADKWKEYGEVVKATLSSISNLVKKVGENDLAEAKNRNEEEKAQLKAQFEANAISKEEYDKKVKESDKKLADEQLKVKQRNAKMAKATAALDIILSTSQGIMKAAAAFPLTGGLPWSAIIAAMGAVQLAMVMATPLPKAARGMYIKGASHARGGVQLEAEGGEMVINKRSSSMFAPLLSAINEAGGGVPFVGTSSDGGFAMREYRRNDTQSVTSDAIAAAVKEAVQEVKIYTAIEDINEGNRKYTALTDSSKF